MSDIIGLNINGNEYTFKDATARNTALNAENIAESASDMADHAVEVADGAETKAQSAVEGLADKVSKSGDTITGTLNVTNGTYPVKIFGDGEGGTIEQYGSENAIHKDMINNSHRMYLYKVNPWTYLNHLYIEPTQVSTQHDFKCGGTFMSDTYGDVGAKIGQLTNWIKSDNWYYRIVGSIDSKPVYEMCYRASHSVAMTQLFNGEYFNNTPLQINFPNGLGLTNILEITNDIQGSGSLFSSQILKTTATYFTLWIKSTISITQDITINTHCYVY